MLISKFAVPIICRILETGLKNSNIRCLSKKECPGNKSSSKAPEKTGCRKKRSRCEEYKAALEKCPKKSPEELCCKPLFPAPAPKCGSSVSDDYKRANHTMKLQAAKVMKLVDESVQSMTNEMLKEVESRKMEESSKMQQIFRKVEEKLSELSQIDPSCGTSKKNKVRLLNHWARRKLEMWQSNTVPNMTHIKLELTRMQNDAKLKSRTAVFLVQSCRKCTSPQALAVCIKKNVQEANKILDNADKNMKERLIEVQNMKNSMLQKNRQEVAEIYKCYSTKMGELSTHLSNCIDSINAQSSKTGKRE